MSLAEIITTYRSKLLHYEQQSEHAIRSAHSHMLSVTMPHLQELLKQYQLLKVWDDKTAPLHWLYTNNKLADAKQLVASQVNHFGAQAKAQVLTTQTHAAGLGLQSAHAQLATVAPAHTLKTPPLSAGKKIIGYTQQGKPIDDLIDGFGEEASDKAGKALISGVSLGKDPDWIDNLIMAALLISLSRALTINRTEEMNVFRDAWSLTMKQNEAQSWIWVARPGCCAFCASMDGTEHDISEDLDSHPNCRCVQKVVTT